MFPKNAAAAVKIIVGSFRMIVNGLWVWFIMAFWEFYWDEQMQLKELVAVVM